MNRLKFTAAHKSTAPMWGFLGLAIVMSGSGVAVGPSYSTRVGAAIDYRINVTIGSGDAAKQYPGEVKYTVESVENGLIRLTASGRINGNRASYGPSMGFGFGQPRSRSLLPDLDYVSISSAKIGIDSTGHVLTSSGDESISFLLGNLGELVLPPLPADGQMTYEQDGTIQITETDRSRNSFMPPGFGSNRDRQGDVSRAIEKTKYTITSIDRGEALMMEISHQHQLNAPHTDPPLNISGDGKFKFDARAGFVDSMQINRYFNINRDGAEFKIPISISIRRETEAEQAAEVEAAAAAKAERERPFTDAERQIWIANLQPGSRDHDAVKVLTELSSFSERLEPQLAAALMTRGESEENSSNWYRQAARFDPKLKVIVDDRRDYGRNNFPVTRTGEAVTSPRMLRPGQIVAVSREPFSRHQAAKIVSVSGNFITYCGVAEDPSDLNNHKVKPYSGFRLAPDTVDQPALRGSARSRGRARTTKPIIAPETGSKKVADEFVMEAGNELDEPSLDPDAMYEWVDRSGKYKVKATFESLDDDVLRLRSQAGKLIEVPLTSLRQSDAERARKLAAEPINPFEVISD